MKIKLIDRYILSQVFFTCIGCIIVFMIVWIMPEILLKTVQRTISGIYTVETAAMILLNEMPKVLNIALPVGMLLGTLITFDKLSKDSELTVLRASGFNFSRIIISVVVLSVFVAGFNFLIGSKLLPVSALKLRNLKGGAEESQFVFPVKNTDGSMNKIIIVSKFDQNYIKDVIVLNFYKTNEKGSSILSEIQVSDYAKYLNDKWILNTVKNYTIAENGVFKNINTDSDREILSGTSAINAYKLMKYSLYRDRELTNAQISDYIKLLKQEQMDDEYRFMLNKYIMRFSHSFMCILFAITGCLLGFSKPRQQKYIGMLAAVGIIFGYYITMPFLDLLAEKDMVSPLITSITAPVCVIILIYVVKKAKNL